MWVCLLLFFCLWSIIFNKSQPSIFRLFILYRAQNYWIRTFFFLTLALWCFTSDWILRLIEVSIFFRTYWCIFLFLFWALVLLEMNLLAWLSMFHVGEPVVEGRELVHQRLLHQSEVFPPLSLDPYPRLLDTFLLHEPLLNFSELLADYSLQNTLSENVRGGFPPAVWHFNRYTHFFVFFVLLVSVRDHVWARLLVQHYLLCLRSLPELSRSVCWKFRPRTFGGQRFARRVLRLGSRSLVWSYQSLERILRVSFSEMALSGFN